VTRRPLDEHLRPARLHMKRTVVSGRA